MQDAFGLFLTEGGSQLPIMILEENSGIPVILGRQGFFENFDITFKESQKKLILTKVLQK